MMSRGCRVLLVCTLEQLAEMFDVFWGRYPTPVSTIASKSVGRVFPGCTTGFVHPTRVRPGCNLELLGPPFSDDAQSLGQKVDKNGPV